MKTRRHHDMGGLESRELDTTEHAHAPWENRARALYDLLVRRHRILTTDEMRRGIEDLGASEYDGLSYYERWVASIARILIEKGVLGVDELGRKTAQIDARWRAARDG